MSLLPSLLRAIVTVDGTALVLQAGEKPYVTSAAGAIDLASGGMTQEAVSDVIGQVLPPESQSVLTQFGAVQHRLGEMPDFPGERFDVIATNEGTQLGVEIRREMAGREPDSSPALKPAATRASRQVDEPALPAQKSRPADSTHNNISTSVRPAPARRTEDADLLERLLHVMVTEGATALHLMSAMPPWVRIDDELQVVAGVPPVTATQIDAMLRRAPDSGASGNEDGREWFWEFPELGRMRCTSFRDHRGQGLVLRSVQTRPPTSRQLGLSRDVEALSVCAEGLIIVAAPHMNGARAVVAALVDLINRTRRVHVISVEREITVIHESEASLVSQRESGWSVERALELSRAALREQPDVLVLESAPHADLLSLAVDAAASGLLVLCAVRGGGVSDVLESLVGLYPPTQRQKLQMALSRSLVGIVAERPEPAGGSGPTERELLSNGPESACLIAEGRFGSLGRPDRR